MNGRANNEKPGAKKSSTSQPGTLGVLHLYLPAEKSIDEHTRAFLDALLQEIALAYQNIHMRSQEILTLRHLQLLHAPESDLTVTLGGLLEGLRQALEAEFILIRLRPTVNERLANLVIHRGSAHNLDETEFDTIFDQVITGKDERSAAGELPVWLALPMTLPEESSTDGASEPGSKTRGRGVGYAPGWEPIIRTLSIRARKPSCRRWQPRQPCWLKMSA
jgi:hypothetical protein